MRSVLIIASLLSVLIFSPSIVQRTYAQSNDLSGIEQNLGDYKIVNIAGVPHLQDKEGFFVFPAFCPTACSAAWAKSNEPPPRTETLVPKAPMATSGENVYTTWWSNKTGDFEVMFLASNDSGKTFGDKINLSNSPNLTSVDAEIAADGNNVYVSWWEWVSDEEKEPLMRVSNDNGKTFGDAIVLSNASSMASAAMGNMTSGSTGNINSSSSALNNVVSALQGQSEPFVEQYRIGAIKAEFTKPGTYSFAYFIKPLLGEFQNLASLQVITLPAKGDNGYVPLDQVSWYKYPYTTVGQSTFKIDKPGTYFIGFGPSQGSALTQLEAEGVPSGFTLKYKLDPLENVKILKPDMDIYIKQEGHGIKYETIGYEELSRDAIMSQAQQFSLAGLRSIGVADENANWLLMRGVSNTMMGGADLRYPLGRNADFAVMRINEFKPILHEIVSKGDLETAQVTTAKILTYLTVLMDEARNSGAYTPVVEDKFTQARNMWLEGDYEGVLPIAAQISKDLLPVIHSEWQHKPSFGLYNINAKIADSAADGAPLSLSGLPITVDFENGGLKQVVTTNEQGENIFVGPPGKFSVYGIKTGDSSDGGITQIDLTMDATTGKWMVDTTAVESPIAAALS